MLRDPIELYEYPYEWYQGDEEKIEKVKSGLYILTEDGFLRRGITTGTTASAAVAAAVASLEGEVESVEVITPSGLKVNVRVYAEDGYAYAVKFAGDHEFDVTDGLRITAILEEKPGIRFGEGVGTIKGRKAVSSSALWQIRKNFEIFSSMHNYKGGVRVEIPEGKKIAKKTRSKLVQGGISILGSTGFVEPWCKKLVETKIKIAKQYERIAITTGRYAWRYALKKYPEFQPFVFGVHLDEILREHHGEKIIVGLPKLLSIWAGGRDKIVEKAKEFGARVEVIEGANYSWCRNL